jgi:hypothetical protein
MKFKKIFLASIFIFSSHSFASISDPIEPVTEFQCTEEEVQNYLSEEGLVDRDTTGKASDAEIQAAYLTYKKKKNEAEGKPNGCDVLLSADFDFSEMAKKVNDLLDMIKVPDLDPISVIYDKAKKRLQEELSKTLCERIPEMAEGFYEDQKNILDIRLEQEKSGILNDTFLKYAQDSNFDNWANSSLDEELKDDKNLVNWRNGVEGELKLSGSVSDWEDKLDDIFN